MQAGGGLTVIGSGTVLGGAVGFAPASRLEILAGAERIHLPFERRQYPDGYGVTRGGTLTFGSAEIRLSLFPPERVSPFVMIGGGAGVARPNVNAEFPDPVTNGLRVMYLGGGVRVPLRRHLAIIGDARAMLGLEEYDSVIGLWPVRANLAWRF